MTAHDRNATAANDSDYIAKCSLSPAQSRIWLLSETGNEVVYGRQILAITFPSVALAAARRALSRLSQQHPLITSEFEARAGGAVQQILKNDRFVEIVETELVAGDDLSEALARATSAERARAIDLADGNPARFIILTQNGEAFGAVFSLHAILADAVTLDLLATDFLRDIDGHDAADIAEEALPDALSWMIANGSPRNPTPELVDFWFQRLTAQENIASLPPQTSAAKGIVDEAWFEQVIEVPVGAAADTSRDMLAALGITLRRHSGYSTQRIGLVTRPQRQKLAARSEDVLILTTDLNGAMTLGDARATFLEEIEAATRQSLPFEALADALIKRDELFDTTGLVKTLLDVRPSLRVAEATSNGATVRGLVEPPARRDADLVVTVSPATAGKLRIGIGFDPQKHDRKQVGRFADDLAIALAQLDADPGTQIKHIPFVSAEELDRLSAPYPDAPEPDDGTPIHEVISAQARRRPNAFAVAQGEKSVTHGELELAANRLAHHLIALGIGPEKRVAIALEKSIDAIVAILAVLKAGGAFTPVEPDHPEARNRHILTAPGLSLVISRTKHIANLPGDIATPYLDLDKTDLSSERVDALATSIAPQQLAYVIYTSGSTGVPKGVAVEHGPLAHHCKATLRIYEMSEESCEYPVLPFTSDGGHERWMVPLMAGGGVVLTQDKLATPEDAFAMMKRHGVNNASLPTSYVRGLAEYAGENSEIPRLRLYSFGGEALSQAVFDMITENLKAQLLINGYGPTETIMTPMIWKIPAGTRFEGTVAPIGRGVGDRRIYVLDADLAPVPVGVIGEIYIGGSGLARGYLGQPELTADRFIPDPFSQGGRLYKSGDLGRWREDGIVEFAGRVDHQIKLRGFRIEPGEIEAVLRSDQRVAEAVILLHNDGGRSSLVAYVVPREGAILSVTELRRAAMTALPDYMVPQTIMLIDKLPMGPNSKLDRAALPAPRIERDMAAPANDKEKAILDVWKDILDIGDIGVTENFFDIGGQSLMAVRIVSRLKMRHPEWPLSIADMFNHPTVRDLALAIDGTPDEAGVDVVYLRRNGDRPVLYCFPGLLVSTREYMRLVDYLGPEQPATGFICYSLTETKTLSTRVEDITARYAEAVRKKANGRPCAFLGWSWGGLLAYEAARQLGNDIDLRMIGMVDVCDMDEEFTVGIMPRFEDGIRERTHAAVQSWLATTPMREDWKRLFAAMNEEVYEQFLHHVVKHNVKLPTDGPDIGSEEHTFWILIDNAMIFRNYRLEQSDFRIHAFAAEDSLTRALNVIDWRRYSPNATASEIVTGTNHLTIIGKTPFHQRFARRLDHAFAPGPLSIGTVK
ncbi:MULTISPECIES: non-ribosomal peptide synthetase [unclassified Rhizobium]|uniref:non-ribosomal peptide synthetase n=1 Tax=unclassified Rhizobium TaxID=2613769 RepID=UPI00068E1CE1|nr:MULTISPECIES: non-ribosomal peptide synthetase [unclassified Rhizobium]OJY60967.1 MAG: non-ribosomal peptide synthetase [Rhizobium sp. 60-20]RKD60951.1 amino acid adenylation domain-containing protein [Rhizobium sp. WW_1]